MNSIHKSAIFSLHIIPVYQSIIRRHHGGLNALILTMDIPARIIKGGRPAEKIGRGEGGVRRQFSFPLLLIHINHGHLGQKCVEHCMLSLSM